MLGFIYSSLGKNVFVIETKFENQWKITPEELEEACRKDNPKKKNKFLIITCPDNPTEKEKPCFQLFG